MQIDYIASLPSSSQPLEYWKKNGAGHWAKYAGAQINGNRVTLTLTDGGAGDADGIENGEIVDPGVVVRMAGPSTATPVPATAPWLIALLSLVLSVLVHFATNADLPLFNELKNAALADLSRRSLHCRV